jgi:hypothetical protein
VAISFRADLKKTSGANIKLRIRLAIKRIFSMKGAPLLRHAFGTKMQFVAIECAAFDWPLV